jgi:hypothetical protein
MSDNAIQITTKGDQNLTNVVNAKYDLIMAAAAPNVKADGNWITRAKLELLAKPDIANLMTTKKGIETALVAIIRAATVGINFGGTKPQAYFVPCEECREYRRLSDDRRHIIAIGQELCGK